MVGLFNKILSMPSLAVDVTVSLWLGPFEDSGQRMLGRLRGTWYLFFLIQVPELDDSNSSRKLLKYC